MPEYNYKARSPNGELVKGKLEAGDEQSLATIIRDKGLFPIDIEKAKKTNSKFEMGFKTKVGLKELAIFCRKFHTMIDAGVTVIDSLRMLSTQTENQTLAKVIHKVWERVQRGVSLSDAMKLEEEVFPVVVYSMVEVGEISGTLDLVLKQLAEYLEREDKIKSKIKTATTYPMTVGIISFIMIVFMLVFVVPRFVGMFDNFGSELPMPTLILLRISELFKSPWFLLGIPIVVVSIIQLFSYIKKTQKGKLYIDSFIMNMPVFGKYTNKIAATRFSRALSLLLQTGVPLIESLDVVNKLLNNAIVSKGLSKTKDEIKRGEALSKALEEIGFFPLMVIQMIAVGEETGALDTIVSKVADFYDDELENSIGKMIALLEPIMIFFLAVVIGAIVIAMILPIFEMYSTVQF